MVQTDQERPISGMLFPGITIDMIYTFKIKKRTHNSCRISGRDNSGTTFIELIIYIAIVTIMLSALIPMAWNIIEGGVKSSTQQEVYSQARVLSERIKYEVRNASGINSLTPTSISLANSNASLNPTVITYSGNYVTITQGTSFPTPVRLHSQGTSVSSFVFNSYSSTDNKTKHVQFAFTLSASNPGPRSEYSENIAIESSAEIRNN